MLPVPNRACAAGPAGGTEIGRALAGVTVHAKTRDVLLVTDGKSYALDVATDWILRANTPGTYAVANEKIGELLADCTNDEMLSILRIIEEVKKAMRHN